MYGAQQLQCKSESAPQIIGAHQPHQACNEYTHVHCCESTVTTGWKRGHSLGTGALFLISESGRGEGGTAISFAARLHGICNASHNRMEEGAHLGHLSYRPALGVGISAPLFPSFVWKGTAVFYPP